MEVSLINYLLFYSHYLVVKDTTRGKAIRSDFPLFIKTFVGSSTNTPDNNDGEQWGRIFFLIASFATENFSHFNYNTAPQCEQ